MTWTQDVELGNNVLELSFAEMRMLNQQRQRNFVSDSMLRAEFVGFQDKQNFSAEKIS